MHAILGYVLHTDSHPDASKHHTDAGWKDLCQGSPRQHMQDTEPRIDRHVLGNMVASANTPTPSGNAKS